MTEQAGANAMIFGTVTLSGEIRSYPALKQLDKTYDKTIGLLNLINQPFRLCYEFTQQGNIHYHFSINTTNVNDDIIILIDLFKGVKKKIGDKFVVLFGFCKIEQAKHPQQVEEYLSKDLSRTESLIKRMTTKKDFFDIFPVFYNSELSRRSKNMKPISVKKLTAMKIEQLDDLIVPLDNGEFDEII